MGGAVVHRLGTVLCLAVVVWCLASAVSARLVRRAARRRLAVVFRTARTVRPGSPRGRRVRAAAVAWAGPAGA
ncbi:hypothetical protein ACFW7J_39660, partial [Streptomyces sp. NPDC059525]